MKIIAVPMGKVMGTIIPNNRSPDIFLHLDF